MNKELSTSSLPGIGKTRAASLEKVGINTLRSLIDYRPVRYQDSTILTHLRELRPGMESAFTGEIVSVRTAGYGKQTRVHVMLEQDGARFSCVWFGAHWLYGKLCEGQWLTLYGRVARSPSGTLTCAHPRFVDKRELLPIYRDIDGVPQKTLREAIRAALDKADDLSSGVPEIILSEAMPRQGYFAGGRRAALERLHFPDSADALAAALDYLTIESAALCCAAMRTVRGRRQDGVMISGPADAAERFWTAQPFTPTGAQRRAADEILADMRSGESMKRLVEGDVGCGKTAVSFLALYAVAICGMQGAMMAPTEILAAQHYRSAVKALEPLGVRCGLLTGGMTAQSRREAVRAIRTGEWQAVFGTHALFSKDIEFARLALAITDEQHRFGVMQRTALAGKAEAPHTLVLSATPIPRTLALLVYGDLKLSVIDELPPGRLPVRTRFVPESKRAGMYTFIKEQAAQGYQTYIVCPHATESESEDCASAQWLAESLREGPLKGLRVGVAHGSQSVKLRAETLDAFHRGSIDALVATTIVEVGLDAPRATVMAIENPERFGLAQLHQLRGRVGRGEIQSWCFLLGEPNDRLSAFAGTNDGFEIARKDLEMRGAGDLMGIRQHGAPEAALAISAIDQAVLARVQSLVDDLMDVGGPEAVALAVAAERRYAFAKGDIIH